MRTKITITIPFSINQKEFDKYAKFMGEVGDRFQMFVQIMQPALHLAYPTCQIEPPGITVTTVEDPTLEDRMLNREEVVEKVRDSLNVFVLSLGTSAIDSITDNFLTALESGTYDGDISKFTPSGMSTIHGFEEWLEYSKGMFDDMANFTEHE